MGYFTQKKKKSVIIYSASSCFLTCMKIFLLLNTEEDILKNMDNQTVSGH